MGTTVVSTNKKKKTVKSSKKQIIDWYLEFKKKKNLIPTHRQRIVYIKLN